MSLFGLQRSSYGWTLKHCTSLSNRVVSCIGCDTEDMIRVFFRDISTQKKCTLCLIQESQNNSNEKHSLLAVWVVSLRERSLSLFSPHPSHRYEKVIFYFKMNLPKKKKTCTLYFSAARPLILKYFIGNF